MSEQTAHAVMTLTLGSALFLLGVGANALLLTAGFFALFVVGSYRGVRSFRARQLVVAKGHALYHHVDHVSTPPLHGVFMLIVVGVVLVGLPLALASIFHFVLPLVGKSWGG